MPFVAQPRGIQTELAREWKDEEVREWQGSGLGVSAEANDDGDSGGVVLTFVVREKPAIRKIYVSGNSEVGLDKIFLAAGFEWREPGCSMCLAMNPDKLAPGERCASTSNRNFEGRQGPGGRTHLVSPAMAAAAAVTGHLTDVRKL